MTDNDENGQCRQCGRDNKGYENDPCSDDCPLYDNPAVRLVAFAPDLLAALESLIADCEAHGLTDNDAHLREARAAIAKTKGA